MRWERLFGDLEAQLDAEDAAGQGAAVAESARHEIGRVELVQRLRAAAGGAVTVATAGAPAPVLRGTLAAVGPDWLLLEAAGEALVPLAAVAWVQGLGRAADVAEPGRVWRRLGLRAALRGLVRDRSTVRIDCGGGDPLVGTLDRVGADHVDLAVHPIDEPRRPATVRTVRTVPLGALRVVWRS